MQDKYYPVPQVLSLVVLFALYQASPRQTKFWQLDKNCPPDITYILYSTVSYNGLTSVSRNKKVAKKMSAMTFSETRY